MGDPVGNSTRNGTSELGGVLRKQARVARSVGKTGGLGGRVAALEVTVAALEAQIAALIAAQDDTTT